MKIPPLHAAMALGLLAVVAGNAIGFLVVPVAAVPIAWAVLGGIALFLLGTSFDFEARHLQRLAGVAALLLILWSILGVSHPNALGKSNLIGLLNRQGEYGVVCLGVALVIIAGGIDLSIGSLMALAAVSFGLMLEAGMWPAVALPIVLLGGLALGIVHGLLVTQLKLQAFLVTLCGMFAYRGLARTLRDGQTGLVTVLEKNAGTVGFREQLLNLRYWFIGQNADERLVAPGMLFAFLGLLAIAGVALHRSAYGRYWYAIGYNEQAAKYAGIATWKHQVSVFAICSLLAAFGGILLFLSAGSITPSSDGSNYELYAITAAVLGGVSLKGGQGTAAGIFLGAMVLPVVKSVMIFTDLKQSWEPWIMGLILLTGAIADELIRRRGAGRSGG